MLSVCYNRRKNWVTLNNCEIQEVNNGNAKIISYNSVTPSPGLSNGYM